MKRLPLFALTACLIVGGAALADTAPSTPAPAAPAAKPAAVAKTSPDDAVVCKNVTYTGSRLGGTRTCMTRQQWRQNEADSQSATVDSQMRGDMANPTGK